MLRDDPEESPGILGVVYRAFLQGFEQRGGRAAGRELGALVDSLAGRAS